MKILLTIAYYPPHMGGAENYAYNIAVGLKHKYSVDVVIVTSALGKGTYKEETQNGIKIYRLPVTFKLSNTPINPLWYFAVKKIIRKEQPDVVNIHTPVPFLPDVTVFASKNIPLVMTYHAGSMIKDKLLTDILITIYQKTILKILLAKAQKIICVSDFVRDNFLREYKNKAQVITPAVDTTLFKPGEKNISRKKTILCIGGLKKAENYKRVVDVFYALKLLHTNNKDIELVMIGDGDNITHFRALCRKLQISDLVVFKGKLSGKKLVEEYQKADVVILPSVNESFGMVLIEAMACKTPVIGTMIGGITSIIDTNNNGLLIEPKNPKAIATAVTTILSDSKLAKQFGENGYKKVMNHYTWDQKIDKTYKLFKSL